MKNLMLQLSIPMMALSCYSLKPSSTINETHIIETVIVKDNQNKGTATLYGQGENFITNLEVKVKFDNFDAYTIPLESGYSPLIATFDFGADDNLLFCSSQTGGSGGYGNYQIYRLETGSYFLVYDDKLDSNTATFGAVFQPNGFMKIRDNTSNNTLDVSVKYMDKAFYNQIFAPDGSVIGEQPYVNAISFVSPALNPASGLQRLITYRSVVAIAEVNRLGYIVQTLDYENGKFVPVFTEFSINI